MNQVLKYVIYIYKSKNRSYNKALCEQIFCNCNIFVLLPITEIHIIYMYLKA